MNIEIRARRPLGTEWQRLVRLGAAAAVFVVVMIPLQAAIFLLSLDYLVLIPFYLSFYAVIRREAPVWGLLALVTGLMSVSVFVISREATFSMWILIDQ